MSPVSGQIEKPDSTERADEREDRRLPFSLADSSTADCGRESEYRVRRGMLEARGEEVVGMMAVTG
jgi:hypothetical protein